jgi:hypothetical protein
MVGNREKVKSFKSKIKRKESGFNSPAKLTGFFKPSRFFPMGDIHFEKPDPDSNSESGFLIGSFELPSVKETRNNSSQLRPVSSLPNNKLVTQISAGIFHDSPLKGQQQTTLFKINI